MAQSIPTFLIPSSPNGYVVEDKHTRGGFRVCVDLTERDAIPPSRRKAGMWVSVGDKTFRLAEDLLTWIDLSITPYDIQFFVQGTIDLTGALLASVLMARTVVVAQGAPGSLARSQQPAALDTALKLCVNAVAVGSVKFVAGSTTGTFDLPVAVNIQRGDFLEIRSDATDIGLCDIGITVVGTSTIGS